MKYLTWDDPDPRVVFDNPNLRWGDPSYLLEAGDPGYVELQPGQPGYVPPPPKPVRQRARGHSLLADSETPNPSSAMSLPYLIIPNPTSTTRPFRARVKLGPQVEADEYLGAVAADSGKDRATVEAVIRSVFKIAIGFARLGRPIGLILGLFRAKPSIAGSFPTNNPTADEIKNGVTFNVSTGPDADATMTDGLSVESQGEVGTVAPEVESVVLSPGGHSGKYSTVAAHRVGGHAFRGSGQNQAWPACYLVDASFANPIALPVFACSQTEMLLGPAPSGTTGTKYLKVVAGWDSTLVFIYQTPLVHV